MAGNFQRLEFGAMWLIALAGVGVTLMTTGFRFIGLGLTAIGLLLFLHRFWSDLRRMQIVLSPSDGERGYVTPSTEFLLALVVIPATALIAAYIFVSSGPYSQAMIDGHSNEGRVTTEQASQSLGKYVCTTDLPAGDGKRALLVEFGVRRRQTNGLYVGVEFHSPYLTVEHWPGSPLRTDKQTPGIFLLYDPKSDPSHLIYTERFQSPTVTPQQSYYLYFEADEPLRIRSLLFVEDYLAVSDQVRVEALAKQFDTCPR